MSSQDPIADMLTRIRNGQLAKLKKVTMASSKIKTAIATVLKREGYIADFSVHELSPGKLQLEVILKYFQGEPVIKRIARISRPGLRVYKSQQSLSSVPGFGTAILSTSKGVLSLTEAKANRVGGEVICEVA